MWMELHAKHFGFRVDELKKIGLPLDLQIRPIAKAVLLVRKFRNDKRPEILLIEDTLPGGPKRFGHLSIVNISTDPFPFNDAQYSDWHNVFRLINRPMKIEIQAEKQYLRGRTVIKIHKFDHYKKGHCLLDANFVNTRGRFFGDSVAIVGNAISFNR